MKLIQVILIALVFCLELYAQKSIIQGSILDSETNQPLNFANVRILNSTIGTAANVLGEYELKLDKGSYQLIASYIGYYSDTISVDLADDALTINFALHQSKVDLPEIVVLPGENPALEIIRKAVIKKNARNEILKQYEFEAFTKGLIRTTEDISASGSSIGIGLGGSDTSELKITGILENHSKGYYKKPDNYKEIILARKQSANFPPSINVLTGGRLVQNFYSDDVNFLGSNLPGPLADNSIDYYYFVIDKVVAQNDQKVFQIYMTPDNSSDPGFEGFIFITDSTFDLIKVDLQLNRAANTGGLFDTINVFQQFNSYNGIYMPADYRLFARANFLGLARFGFELNTILFDYKINTEIPATRFDKAVVTALTDADQKDSSYWINTQTIPNTFEESMAYSRIDSLEQVPKTLWDRFSPLSTTISLSKNVAVSAPLGMYHFNRVEGHALDFGFFADDLLNKRLNADLSFSYGFSDKKFKKDFSAKYFLGDYRTFDISIKAYDRLNILFEQSEKYNDLTATALSLLTKYEYRDYYYSKGWGINLSGEVFPILRLNAGFSNSTDNNAFNNSNFSFFYKNRNYSINPPIYETRINALSFGFTLDFRNYIEDGYHRRRTSFGKSYILFSGNVTHSDKENLSSGLDFTTYSLSSNAFIKNLKYSTLNVRFFGMYNTGSLPYQNLFSLPGNITALSRDYSFRTLRINEFFGDRIFTVNIQQDFRDELFKMLKVPLLKDIELTFSPFLNIAVSKIGEKSSSILPAPIKTFNKPFYEIGFGIGQVMMPLKLEFAWKLNYRDENNFVISLNSLLF